MPMPSLRETIKRSMPGLARAAGTAVRSRMAPPPLEDVALHDYVLAPDPSEAPRLTLVIPSISPNMAFGGVTTGLDIFLGIGRRTGAQLRILLDDYQRVVDRSVVDKRARDTGLDPAAIEIAPRTAHAPTVPVRAADIFFSFNWWTTLNVRKLLREQAQTYGLPPRPQLYAIQEYEPLFYPFSSTHMMAREAFEPRWPCWGMFNTMELYDFFRAQGHRVERAFVFEPRLSNSLRPFLAGEPPTKTRRILVYGRPTIPRNCFPSVRSGLRFWAERNPDLADWEVMSAGLPHPPLSFAPNCAMRSLGKLSLEDYAQLLRGSAVGLSLMASPHPSYPPLEMAHFGLRTITNSYANKNLASAHPNILSIDAVDAGSVADALTAACRAFEADPEGAWRAETNRPSFLAVGDFEFLDEISEALKREIWGR